MQSVWTFIKFTIIIESHIVTAKFFTIWEVLGSNPHCTLSVRHENDIKAAGVNIINVLLAAFAYEDPKSIEKTDNLTVFFALLGSVCVNAARRMLMKLTPGSFHQWYVNM